MSRLLIKRTMGTLWNFLPKSKGRRVILIYHSVGSTPWATTEARFEEQIKWLKDNARLVSLEQLISATNVPGLHAAITFDDGYKSVHTIAAPLLAKHQCPATVYINPACIANRHNIASNPSLGHYPGEEFLTWQEVSESQQIRLDNRITWSRPC